MADIVRPPLFVNRREPPPKVATAFALGAMLTLAGLPVGAQCLPLQVHQRPVLNADTSHGTPKTLTADAQLPVGKQSLPPQVIHAPGLSVLPDGSRGTPKTLTGDAQFPIQTPPFTAASQFRNLSDTSAGTPKTLTADAQAPVGKQSGLVGTPEPRRSVVDTSRGTPKPLTADAQSPVGQQTGTAVPEPRRSVVDTSAGVPKALTADAQFPAQVYQHTAPDRLRWLPASTTASTAKVLFGDAQAPVGQQSTVAPDRFRPLGHDTSAGTPKTLYADVPVNPLPPGVQALHQSVQWCWNVTDTSYGVPYALQNPPVVVVVPPTEGLSFAGGAPTKKRKKHPEAHDPQQARGEVPVPHDADPVLSAEFRRMGADSFARLWKEQEEARIRQMLDEDDDDVLLLLM